MQPKSPFIQSFDQLPEQLPLYPLENALLPGGELPLELAKPADLALFMRALKTDQLIGMVQPRPDVEAGLYQVGCAGRIRQYRERKDGRLNIMLTGLCRYKLIEILPQQEGYVIARVDWQNFAGDYRTEEIESIAIDRFKTTLRDYFDRHKMQVDWKVLDELPIEQVVNNLVLILNLTIESKQQLLESATLKQRLDLFGRILAEKSDPILSSAPSSHLIN